jgi:transcriptional regulator with XRE-family HTH domain
MNDRFNPGSALFGEQLKSWRKLRQLSQLELALRADVSARHLCFVETGRAKPGRSLIVRLCEELDVPLRERNKLLLGAGYSPAFNSSRIDDPGFDTVRQVMHMMLERQKPYPGFVIDRNWQVVMSNAALPELYEGVTPKLMMGSINVVRMILHPEGLAPRVRNLPVWHSYYVRKIRRQIELTNDPYLEELLQEILQYPVSRNFTTEIPVGPTVPLIIDTKLGQLSFISATTVFGSPVDVSLEELALELLHPADSFTEKLGQFVKS